MLTALIAINLLGFFFIALLIKHYFSAYTSEKGKNLATKEDVSELTKLVEEVKSTYMLRHEETKFRFQVQAALTMALSEKSLSALEQVNSVLANLTKYCWGRLANYSDNEWYTWEAIKLEEEGSFGYYRVLLDEASIDNALYLTSSIRKHLEDLSVQLGLLASMERALDEPDPIPEVVESAASGYNTGLEAVNKCRDRILKEMGLSSLQPES